MRWFEIALVSLTLITGLVWLVDKLWLRSRREAGAGLIETKEPVLVDYSRAFFPVLLVVLLLRSFVAEPFRIPTGSMMPTLLVGDFILVNKFSYGLRLPINNRKVVALGEPQRGDVAVFRFPGYPCEVGGQLLRSGDRACANVQHEVPVQDWIKRVIGLPGDTVAYYDEVLSINGQPLQYRFDGIYQGTGSGADMTGARLVTEFLADRPHQILERDDHPMFPTPGEGEWVVPEGHYLVMGDNRDNSEDGRFWGVLPEENLRGKAIVVWMNFDRRGGGIDFSRIGTGIR
ncbi:MAG: signal peptidase I [Pseudoxanthomonas suwonensis]|nr:signal peptidase I [Pseudoxanthomonas suwonensis]